MPLFVFFTLSTRVMASKFHLRALVKVFDVTLSELRFLLWANFSVSMTNVRKLLLLQYALINFLFR